MLRRMQSPNDPQNSRENQIVAIIVFAILFVIVGVFWTRIRDGVNVFFEDFVVSPSEVIGEFRDASGLPGPDDTESIRFGFVSDTETAVSPVTATFRAIAHDMGKEGVDHAVHLGDFAHRTDADAYDAFAAFIGETPFPWTIVPGNHDLLQPGSVTGRDYDDTLFMQTFGSTNTSKSFFDGRIQLVTLNNADNTIGFSEADLSLLSNALCSAEDRDKPCPPRDHVLIAMHRPVNVPAAAQLGISDGTAGAADASYARFEDILANATNDAEVTLFAGHIHSTFEYELAGRRVVVTGGGGSDSNVTSLGVPSFPHWYSVDIDETGALDVSLQTLD